MTPKEKMDYIFSLGEKGQYDAALDEIVALEKSGVANQKLKIMKAAYIQLGESPRYDLSDAERALREAIELDDENPQPYLELGWYLFAVQDLADDAIPCFTKAKELAQHTLSEATDGLLKARNELSGE